MSPVTRSVLVTGGTGVLGTVLLADLAGAGHRVRVLSRHPSPPIAGAERVVGDLASGVGLDAATAGVDVVVHLASDPVRAKEVDVDGTRRLLAAAGANGVSHIIFMSIVGCDRIPYSYYRAKAEIEAQVLAGPVPGSVLRATQFHEFVPQLAARLGRGPILLLPQGLRSQLVDLRDVSARLVAAVASGPAGRLADLGGPEVLSARDAIADWSRATGRRTPLFVPIPTVGRVLRAFADGRNLPGPEADLGHRRFDAWLAERPGARGGEPGDRS